MATVIETRPPRIKSGVRLDAVDRLRGLAIVLMLLDHALAFVISRRPGGAEHDLLHAARLTVTRPAMPLFMLLSGAVAGWRGWPSQRRMWSSYAVALVMIGLLASAPFGIGTPEIIGVWLFSMCALRLLVVAFGSLRGPLVAVVLGAVQVSAWPVSDGWPFGGGYAGYQPGVVLTLLSVGYIVGVRPFEVGNRLPMWLAVPGRHALAVYATHMVALVYLGTLLDRL